jgi:NAD(P)-dependent dehydrogenase (short-subunit alcohol dehydrogenase family)
VSDKSVAITGAASGIGAALARRFARAGCRLGLLDRDDGLVHKLAADLRAGGASVVAEHCDVTRFEECMAALDAVRRAHGGIDVLVNNAGITHVGLFRETDVDVIRRVMEVNFFGAVNCTKAALPSLLERRGQIIVLSSVAGLAPLATRTGYSASKHALHGFFESLRVEHANDGLAVTIVCPSFVRTRIGEHALAADGGPAARDARTGVRGAVEPDVVAEAIFDAASKRRRSLLIPRRARFFLWIWQLAPSLYERLMARRTMT